MTVSREQAAELLGALSSLARTLRAQSIRDRELGGSGTGHALLKTLDRGDTRPGDLALALQVDPSVISRAAAPLEQAGLIERKPDPADARAALLGLTDRGRQRLAALQEVILERLIATLHDWSDDDIRVAGALLTRLDDALVGYSPSTDRRLLTGVDDTRTAAEKALA